MRVFSFRTALCLTLAALVTSTAVAGVRGKLATKSKDAASVAGRVALSDTDYGVNSVPVPADSKVTSEKVIRETTINPANTLVPATNINPATNFGTDPNSAYAAPGGYQANPDFMPTMMMPTPMLAGPGCSNCGGMGGGLSPAAAAGYYQAFGPGLYRSGAEAGQYHYPYYSYRRPWYFPGQPSFHRSTDYVW